MLRLSRSLFAIAIFALASFAHADAVRLVAPAAGATLRGGSFVELRWSAAQLPPLAEEWEAFLSVNGGKYYAFRVTPHLDIDLQSFTFAVPNVETHEARILIRTGDEVHETYFESGGSFSITRDAHADAILPAVAHTGGGESARDGDPAVLAWASGPRNGAAVTQNTSNTVPSPYFDRTATVTRDASAAVAPALHCIAAPSTAVARLGASEPPQRADSGVAISVDLLLMCRRRNI
jgi:hypothetical protein